METSKLSKKNANASKPMLASREICTGCLACVDVCPKNAIEMVMGTDGHIYVQINNDLCVKCLACQHTCMNIHKRDYACNENKSLAFSVYNTDATLYSKATSGGVFSAIAMHFLEIGGAVYGAAYKDGYKVEHKRITTAEDLVYLQGSKYIQSNMKGVYSKIKADLNANVPVLFSGTGCQVAAVLSFFACHKNRNMLYTMDLICGGVPSSLLMEKFRLNARPPFKEITRFRNKNSYEFAYRDTSNHEIICKKSLPLDGFNSFLTNRYSCYDCEYAGFHRKSDWTIGDLWGISNEKKHCSLCVTHTNRALEMLNNNTHLCVKRLDDWSFALRNPRLVNGKSLLGKRFERIKIEYLFKKCSYRTLCKIYASDIKKTDFFWLVYKVYRFIRFKLYARRNRKLVAKIVSRLQTDET